MPQRLVRNLFGSNLLALLLLVFAGQSAVGGIPTEVQVLESTPDRTVLEIRLGTFEMQSVDAAGKACVIPTLEGEPLLMERGAPELPAIRQALIVGDETNLAVRILDVEYETLKIGTIAPSKGHLLRTQDPKDVPFEFGPVYQSDAYYPEQQAVLHEPFIIRDFRGVIVEVRPLRYRPGVGELQVARRMVVEVAGIPGKAANPLHRTAPLRSLDADFAPVYSNIFSNWPPASYKYTTLGETGRCLILTADAFYNQVLPLYEWELQKGVPTILKKLSEVGTTATQIKTYIQSLYNQPERLTYIILVGDSAQMPYLTGTAEGAPSDPMYVKLAGSDSYPDAFISRISAQNATQVETQVARSIRYEKTPDLGAAGDWYHMATGIASNASGGTPPLIDWQRAELLRTELLAYGYTSVDAIYDPGATKAMVSAALNEGRGLVNYIGHGATTYWVTTSFGVSDVYALNNGFKNPYICDVACVNGNFTFSECLAEAFLRAGTAAAPKGAIGMYAPTTNASWVPPCVMQTEVVRLLTEELKCTLGGLSFNGVMEAMDTYPGPEGTKLMEQYHLFGDCTVMMRTTNPGALVVDHSPVLYLGDDTFAVSTPGTAGARAALYAGEHLYGVGYTDGSGTAILPVNPLPANGVELLLTVTAFNCETVIDTVVVTPRSDAHVQVADSGGALQEAVAGEPLDLSILLYNAGPDTAHGVTAILRPIAATATIQDSTAAYGEIAPLENGASGLDTYIVTPDPNLPDSTMIQLALEIRSTDYQEWSDTLSVRVHAPIFVYKDAVIDDNFGDEDGRMDHGESCLITIGIWNRGSADAHQISAVLNSTDPGVEITQPSAALMNIRSGEEAYFAGTFTVHLLPTVSEGMIEFSAFLTTATGRQQVLVFSLPAGGYLETVEYGAPFCSHDTESNFLDEWHVTGSANVTAGGTHSWKCGAVGDGAYSPLDDARLVATPPLQVAGGATLSFWHKMSAEVDSSQTGVALDGGIIEISVDSLAYAPLTPSGGYPYIIHDRGNGGPFAEGTGCYSGTFGWTKTEIDLTAYSGTVRIRFRFGSDAEGAGLGWWIDEIEVRGLDAVADAPDLIADRGTFVLGPAQPNPFNPRTRMDLVIPESGLVRLQIIDAAGRLVATLLDESCAAGERSVVWDGRSDAGRMVPSGVYYARLDHAGKTQTGRLVLLK